jgi:hypothetical protein
LAQPVGVFSMMGDHKQTRVITPHRSSAEDFLNHYRNVSIHLKHRSLVSDGAMHDAEQGGLSSGMSRGSNCQRERLDLQMTWRPGTHYSLLSLDPLIIAPETVLQPVPARCTARAIA